MEEALFSFVALGSMMSPFAFDCISSSDAVFNGEAEVIALWPKACTGDSVPLRCCGPSVNAAEPTVEAASLATYVTEMLSEARTAHSLITDSRNS